MSIKTRRTEIRYKDFKPNLNIHPVKGDLVINTNEDSVKRRIKNLLFTDYYERFFEPELGGGLKQYLFENVNQFTADNIKERIIFTIENYEPSAKLHEVSVDVANDNNSYTAKIIFSILNNPDKIVLTSILKRIR